MNMHKGNSIKFSIIGIIIMALVVINCKQSVYAYDNGAYTVSRTTSYVNPETGATEDGGTNIALGDSMCSSIVDTQVLVEVVDGRTYVTLGIGLISNISNIRIAVQSVAGGGYSEVSTTLTGSCSRDGDTCNHYRFEVTDPNLYIRPTFYVAPMGRDVTFFIKLNMGSMTSGTANYVSEMVPVPTEAATEPATVQEVQEEVTQPVEVITEEVTQEPSSEETQPQTESQSETETIIETEETTERETDIEEILKNTTGLTLHYINSEESTTEEPVENVKKGNMMPIVAGIALVIAASGAGVFVYRRKGSRDEEE